MKTIWKYTIPLQENVVLEMPKEFEILSFLKQGNDLCLWGSFPSNNKHEAFEARSFCIVGTGHDYDDSLLDIYIGTVIYGSYVWHLYEISGEDE